MVHKYCQEAIRSLYTLRSACVMQGLAVCVASHRIRRLGSFISVDGQTAVPLLLQVATTSMPLYATLPALTEAVVERGWTRVYSRVDDVGLGWYIGYFVLYMASVEFFVYWMHRGLHDVRIGYR